jgi:hexokinase
LQSLTAPFLLDDEALGEVRARLAERITEGLAAEDREIRALPAWFSPPDPELSGRAVVVDTGGTHMRAALVELSPGTGARVLAGPFSDDVPRDAELPMEGQGFFRAQAALVRELGAEPDVPVGYCFSYPSSHEPDGDATLISWTKGVSIKGVEGTRVGRGLREAMTSLGLRPGPVRVLNDTVAALAAGAYLHGAGEYPETIGLIVGTGSNMAAFLPRDAVPKLGPTTGSKQPGRIAVNLESGNYHPPHLTAWDDAMDAASDNPGRQRLEKAVSGFYLPQLFRTVLPAHTELDPDRGSQALVELRDGAEGGDPALLAGTLLDRSADLIAAALAGLCDTLPGARAVTTVAEGSLIWRAPGFAERVGAVASRLLGKGRPLRMVAVPDANLVGSACAALCQGD